MKLNKRSRPLIKTCAWVLAVLEVVIAIGAIAQISLTLDPWLSTNIAIANLTVSIVGLLFACFLIFTLSKKRKVALTAVWMLTGICIPMFLTLGWFLVGLLENITGSTCFVAGGNENCSLLPIWLVFIFLYPITLMLFTIFALVGVWSLVTDNEPLVADKKRRVSKKK